MALAPQLLPTDNYPPVHTHTGFAWLSIFTVDFFNSALFNDGIMKHHIKSDSFETSSLKYNNRIVDNYNQQLQKDFIAHPALPVMKRRNWFSCQYSARFSTCVNLYVQSFNADMKFLRISRIIDQVKTRDQTYACRWKKNKQTPL